MDGAALATAPHAAVFCASVRCCGLRCGTAYAAADAARHMQIQLRSCHLPGTGQWGPPPYGFLLQEYRAILQRHGLDCRGWALVLCGHSLGAGIAALLAPHFKDWWPGEVPGCEVGTAGRRCGTCRSVLAEEALALLAARAICGC